MSPVSKAACCCRNVSAVKLLEVHAATYRFQPGHQLCLGDEILIPGTAERPQSRSQKCRSLSSESPFDDLSRDFISSSHFLPAQGFSVRPSHGAFTLPVRRKSSGSSCSFVWPLNIPGPFLSGLTISIPAPCSVMLFCKQIGPLDSSYLSCLIILVWLCYTLLNSVVYC